MVLESNELNLLWLQDGEQGIPGPKGDDGSQKYIWVKYAKLDDYGDISDESEGAVYIGIAYDKLDVNESTDPADYKWSKIKGEQGEQGDSAYTVILDNENVSFSTDNLGRSLLDQEYTSNIIVYKGTEKIEDFEILAEEITPPDGLDIQTEEQKVTLRSIKGSIIAADYGNISIPVKVDGIIFVRVMTYTLVKSSDAVLDFVWIKYSDTGTPTTAEQMHESPDGMTYLGIAYGKDSAIESDDPSDYEWIQMNTESSHVISTQEIYYISMYTDIAQIPLPSASFEIVEVNQGDYINVAQGILGIGQARWTEERPDYVSGYHLWVALRIGMSDGTYLYTTPMLSPDWEIDDTIGGLQLIRHSKTLIDSRIYWQ